MAAQPQNQQPKLSSGVELFSAFIKGQKQTNPKSYHQVNNSTQLELAQWTDLKQWLVAKNYVWIQRISEC